MGSVERERADDQLAEALAAYHDLLAAGKEPPPDWAQAVDPTLVPEWNWLASFLNLVEEAWPRAGEKSGDVDAAKASIPESDRHEDRRPGPPSAEPEVCRRFGRFQIRQALGQGGFGVVFLAWDPVLRRNVALKVPQPEALLTPEARKRFQRKAHAAAGLDHPNIVPVYESGSAGTIAYIASAYCPGPTLADWLARQSRPVPARDAAALSATLARAIEHAHERGVLHRDMKPSNILLQRGGPYSQHPEENDSLASYQPRITDFSLAWLADGEGPATRSGAPFGSPPYMAPEQAEGKLKAIGPPTDVYGLGCTLYELLTGGPPFRGESQLETLRRLIADDPVPPRRTRQDVPAELDAIVLRCLEKASAARYPTARAVAEDLDRFLAGEPTLARPPGAWVLLRRKARRHRTALFVLAAVAACAVLLLAGGLIYETRLDAAHRLTERKDAEARARESANERHRQDVSDIRLAERLLGEGQSPRAQEILARLGRSPGEDDGRDFARYHLLRRCHTEKRTLTGHRGDVYHVEFSPGGDFLVSTGKDGMVLIRETKTWQVARSIKASATEVNGAVFSPDSKTLAAIDDEGKLKLWEIATSKCTLELDAHAGEASGGQFLADGQVVMTGGRKDGFIKLWDRKTGGMRKAIRAAQTGYLDAAAVSPDRSILATVGGKDVKLWNLASGALIASLSASGGGQSVVFSHDGTKLAVAAEGDRLVRVWDISSGRLLRTLLGHSDGVFSVLFSPDDRRIISASDDATIRIWDSATGVQLGMHQGHSGKIWSLALSPDGRTIASASHDGTVKLWDSEPPSTSLRLPITEPRLLSFGADGQSVSVLEVDRSEKAWFISCWDVFSGSLRERNHIELNGQFQNAWFLSDGEVLAIATTDGVCTFWNAGGVRLESSRMRGSVPLGTISFSPKNRYLMHRFEAGRFALRDLSSSRDIPLPWTEVCASVITPSEEVIAARWAGELIRWDPRTEPSTALAVKGSPFSHLMTIAKDGRTLALVDYDLQTIELRSAETLRPIKAIARAHHRITALALRPGEHARHQLGRNRQAMGCRHRRRAADFRNVDRLCLEPPFLIEWQRDRIVLHPDRRRAVGGPSVADCEIRAQSSVVFTSAVMDLSGFFERLEHLGRVPIDLHFREDVPHDPFAVDDEGRSLDAHVLLPVHVFLFPDAIIGTDLVADVREQGKRKVEFLGELGV